MNWFERHLNWSLFLGLFIIPFIITVVVIVLLVLGLAGGIFESLGKGSGLALGGFFIILGLVLLAMPLVVTWWYLGKKARSKWYLLLILVPWVLSIIGSLLTGSSMVISPDPTAITAGEMFGGILSGVAGLINLLGLIWLFLLENRAIGYGGDFDAGAATDRWVPDTGQYSTSDTLQPPKQLDYNPANRVHDIVYGSETHVPRGKVPAAPSEVKAAGPTGWQYASSAPILLDETGAAIKCYYHPEADAVNSCSRCGQYVCSQCNYVTGTHPICHNCWGKPATKPIAAAPVRKQEIPKPAKSEKHAESSVSSEPAIPTMTAASEAPATPPVYEAPAAPVVPEAYEATVPPAVPHIPATPESSAIPQAAEFSASPEITTVPAESAIVAAPVAPTAPITPADAAATTEVPSIASDPIVTSTPAISAIPVQQQETPKLTKSDKRKMEDDERFRQFMLLYEQALPFISAVVAKNPEGLPASPLDLMEGLKLGPMLKYAKKLPKPREKELQEAKKLFEQLLDACVKVGEKAADFVSSSGHIVPTEANFARLANGVEKANIIMGQLTRKLPPPSHPQV